MKNITLSRVKEMAKPHMKSIVIVSILSLIVSICEIIRPYIIKIVIDEFLSKGIYEMAGITVATIGAIYIGIVIIEQIINFISTTATNILGEDIIYEIRNKLFRYIQYANIPFHDKTPAGKLFVRITNDAEDISTLFKDVISTIVKDIILLIAIVCIMIYISWQLSISSFIVLPFVITVSIVLTKMLNRIQDKSKVIRTNLNTFLAESIYGAKVIKIFNIQDEKIKECNKYTRDFKNERSKGGVIQALLPGLLTILENLGITIIIYICIQHWFGTNVEVGIIYVFITYIKQLFEPITRIVENMETVQEAFTSINKIYDILDEKQYIENLEEGRELKNVNGKIEFKNVWFSYDDINWVLKDVSFTINPGESVAFVGKTGSRKNDNNKFNK